MTKRRYFRVIVTYTNGETSAHRVFKDRTQAEKYAARLNTPVVTKVAVEEFVSQSQVGRRVYKKGTKKAP
jgi:hypothetical protein